MEVTTLQLCLRNPQKNPKLNEETKRKWENILANGGTNDLGLPLDDPIVVDVSKGKKPTNALQKHQELQSYNNHIGFLPVNLFRCAAQRGIRISASNHLINLPGIQVLILRHFLLRTGPGFSV